MKIFVVLFLIVLTNNVFGHSFKKAECDMNEPILNKSIDEFARDDSLSDAEIEWMKDRLIQNSNSIETLKKYLSATPNPFEYAPYEISVSPGLVRMNEDIRISLRCEGTVPVASMLTIEKGYLSTNNAPEALIPSWTEMNGISTALATIRGDEPGNWRIIWNVDGHRFSRIVAVISKNYAVCTLWSGNNKPIMDQEVHQFDLPVDQWMKDWWSPFDRSPERLISNLYSFAGFHKKYGQHLVPFVNAEWILPGIKNKNLMDVPTEIQRIGLKQMCEIWDLLGLGPVKVLGSYTFGSQTPALAKELGIRAINSLCQWQNWRDGADDNAWRINHWGAPIAPYFVADDDFRKAGPNPSNNTLVAFGMGTASSTRNYSIYTMEGCPSLSCPLQRYEKSNAQSPNVHRFYVAVQGWLNDAKYQDEVYFTVGLENFMGDPDWQKANALGIEYLVNCAKKQNLVFASSADIAEYFQRHYKQQPEHAYFQPDIYCGYRCNAKPAVIADRIELSNHLFHSLHAYPDLLPQFCWDFTKDWDASAWDEKTGLRNQFNLIVPEVVTPDNCIPAITDFRGIKVQKSYTQVIDGIQVEITVNADKSYINVPIALWDIPIVPSTAIAINTPPGVTIKPVVNKHDNILHSIATIVNINEGKSTIIFNISGKHLAVAPVIKNFGNGISGRLFHTDEKDYLYLWRQDGISSGNFVLRYLGKPLTVLLNDGTQVQVAENKYIIPFDDSWQHETPVVIGKNVFVDDLSIVNFKN